MIDSHSITDMNLNGRRSMRDFFAILKNRMEERVLKNKIGSIELEEKRLLRRFRSETRLLKIKQEQRLGNLSLKRQDSNATHINKASPSPQSPEVCRYTLLTLFFLKLALQRRNKRNKRLKQATVYFKLKITFFPFILLLLEKELKGNC